MIGKRYTAAVLLSAVLFITTGCGKKEPAGKVPVQRTDTASSEDVYLELRSKLEKNPEDIDSLYHLADLYERNAQYKEAIETYSKVVRLKPGMGYAYFKMGTAYDRLDKPTEAIAEFAKALKYMPNYAVLYNNMGVAYGKLGKFADEIKSLKKAIKLRPSYYSARFNLGVTYLKTGKKGEAMEEYEAIKKFDGGTAEALMKEIKKAS